MLQVLPGTERRSIRCAQVPFDGPSSRLQMDACEGAGRHSDVKGALTSGRDAHNDSVPQPYLHAGRVRLRHNQEDRENGRGERC